MSGRTRQRHDKAQHAYNEPRQIDRKIERLQLVLLLYQYLLVLIYINNSRKTLKTPAFAGAKRDW